MSGHARSLREAVLACRDSEEYARTGVVPIGQWSRVLAMLADPPEPTISDDELERMMRDWGLGGDGRYTSNVLLALLRRIANIATERVRESTKGSPEEIAAWAHVYGATMIANALPQHQLHRHTEDPVDAADEAIRQLRLRLKGT